MHRSRSDDTIKGEGNGGQGFPTDLKGKVSAMTELSAGEISLLIALVLATFGACLLPRVFRKMGHAIRKAVPTSIPRNEPRMRC